MRPYPFVLATSARAGGNFLMDLLTSTGVVGEVKERLQEYKLRDSEVSDAEVADIFHTAYQLSGGKDSWGMKVDMRDLFVLEGYLRLRRADPKAIKWIWLKRIDKAKQTLSYLKAIKTERFHLYADSPSEDFEQDRTPVNFDMRLCKDYMLRFFIIEHTWLHYFRLHGITPHTLYYEDFVDESTWESTVAGIFDFLGVPYELPLNVSSEHVKQHENSADAVYEELKNLMPYYPYHYTFFGGSDESRPGKA